MMKKEGSNEGSNETMEGSNEDQVEDDKKEWERNDIRKESKDGDG